MDAPRYYQIDASAHPNLLHHLKDLQTGEWARRIEIVTTVSIHSGNKLAHVSSEVVSACYLCDVTYSRISGKKEKNKY